MVKGLFPDVADRLAQLQDLAEREGIQLRVTTGYRSPEEQERLYAQGRTTPGKIVTHAKPGQSRHQSGRAFDVVVLTNGKPDWESPHYWRVGELGKGLGLTWGGDFRTLKDLGHFELPGPGGSPPPPARQDKKPLVDELIRLYATKAGVDPDLAVAVATQESGLDPRRMGDNGQSVGLFQLQEAAARDAGIDPRRRGEIGPNIQGGIAYLKQGLDRYGGDVRQALERHYNRGGDPDYYAHVMQYYPQASRPQPGLLARVGQALSPASAEATTPGGVTPTMTPHERAALEAELQQLKALREQMRGRAPAAPAETFPPLAEQEAASRHKALTGALPPGYDPTTGMPPARSPALAQQQQATQHQPWWQSTLEAIGLGNPSLQLNAPDLPTLVQESRAQTPEERATVGDPLREFGKAELAGLTTMLGTAFGASVLGVPGLLAAGYGMRKFNVATGLEEPGLGGDIASVALPGLGVALPFAKRAAAGVTRWSRAGKAMQEADEATRAAQQTYTTGVQEAAEQTRAQRAKAVTQQQQRDAAYQQRAQQQRTRAETAHTTREAERRAAHEARQGQRAETLEQTQARQAQEYQEQLQRYEQAVQSQRAGVTQARAIPGRYTPETPGHVLYKKVAEIAPEAPVTLTRTQEVATELQDVVAQVPSLQPTRMGALVGDLQVARSTQSVREVQRYLTDLGTLTRSPDASIRRQAKQLYAALHDDLAASASRLPQTEAARDLLLQANAAYRRQFAVEDLRRVLRRGLKVGDDGIPRVEPGRILTQYDRLVEEDRFFAGSFTPEELTQLRGQLEGFTSVQKIPTRPPAPAPGAPFQPEPFTPTPFKPPAPPPQRAPYTAWTPDVPGPTPPEAVVPKLTPREQGAFRQLLRGVGLTEAAFTGGLGPLSKVALAVEAKDKLADALATMMLSPRWQPYVRQLMQADGTVNLKALRALAWGRVPLTEAGRGLETWDKAYQQHQRQRRQRSVP